jgi:hypothetical protein
MKILPNLRNPHLKSKVSAFLDTLSSFSCDPDTPIREDLRHRSFMPQISEHHLTPLNPRFRSVRIILVQLLMIPILAVFDHKFEQLHYHLTWLIHLNDQSQLFQRRILSIYLKLSSEILTRILNNSMYFLL